MRLKTSTVDSFIGRNFFYGDKETGIGWESKIDSLYPQMETDSYAIELSCGTIVKMSRLELLAFRNSHTVSNYKE